MRRHNGYSGDIAGPLRLADRLTESVPPGVGVTIAALSHTEHRVVRPTLRDDASVGRVGDEDMGEPGGTLDTGDQSRHGAPQDARSARAGASVR